MKVSLKQDGDKWCLLFGENLQEGISGFGETKEDAIRNFLGEIFPMGMESHAEWVLTSILVTITNN